jgi:hypothetical protein
LREKSARHAKLVFIVLLLYPVVFLNNFHCLEHAPKMLLHAIDMRRAWLTSPSLLTFAIFYMSLVWYCRRNYYRDPTSAFFDPALGYRQHYSEIRQHEAESFIQSAAEKPFHRSNNTVTPALCVGIATIKREGARYFHTSIGALLHGLTDTERQAIHLITLIAHTDPTVHPAYSETWLHNVADDILIYDLSPEQAEHVKVLEGEQGLFREKALFDYQYLLNACYKIGAPNIIMIEDDVLPQNGWYSRTIEALHVAQIQTHLKGYSDCMLFHLILEPLQSI